MNTGTPAPETDISTAAAAGRFTLCVYCGSRLGAQPAYRAAAEQVGRDLARRGWGLVYGGGKVGLMGVVADAALAGGAPATGIIPRSLMQREVGHAGLQELLVVDTMHQRKQAMADRAAAFVALPGGIGTFEEFFEVWTWAQLGYHAKPVGLLNVAGYYDGLLGFLQHSRVEGFTSDEQHAMIVVESDPVRLLDALAARAKQTAGAAGQSPADYGRI